jgi:NTE family protein
MAMTTQAGVIAERGGAGSRALVLGAGGHAASAWEIGVIAGLADAGVDVRKAEVIVGTSAGSRVALRLASAQSLDELYAEQLEPDPATAAAEEVPGSVDVGQWRGACARAREGATGTADTLRRLGQLMAPPSANWAERRAKLESALPLHEWPERAITIAAVDAGTGERRGFDRASGVDLVDAVGASCAVPGLSPLAPIAGHLYMDGGTYSIDNVDLALGFDRVLVLSLRAREPPICVVSLDEGVARVRAAGGRVDVILPDKDSEAAFQAVGNDVLDPAVRAGAAKAGRQQGRGAASVIAAIW